VETITRRLKERRNRPGDETGFSLIELMIVLLVIAVLLAVAIPTYLSARDRAENRAAQETLNHANTLALSTYARNGTWTGNGTIFSASFQANIGTVENGDGAIPLGTSQSGALPPGTPLNQLIAENHGGQWVLLENASQDGWCFGVLSVESASSTALTGHAALGPGGGAPTVDLGSVPGVGTWYAAEKQQGGSCTVGGFASGWQSTWSAATAAV